MPEAGPALSPEDAKLLTLARATQARTGADEGACVRDLDGRTYAGATVDLPSLHVSALGVAVAMAAVGGSTGLEAALVLTDAEDVARDDLRILTDFAGSTVQVMRADARGQVVTIGAD